MKLIRKKELNKGFLLTLEDGSEIKLSSELYFRESLYEKEELTTDEIKEIKFKQEVLDAENLCKRSLAGGLKPKRQLLLYLEKKEFTGEAAIKALDNLEKDNYLDDKRYAIKRIKRKMSTAPVSSSYMIKWLVEREVSEQAAQAALDEYGLDDRQTAVQLKNKKIKTGEKNPVKIAAHLSRKGFDADIIADLLGTEVLWKG